MDAGRWTLVWPSKGRSSRPDGVATVFEYDAAGRLTAVVEHARDGVPADHATNVRTTYSYDPNGNLLAISDANGHTQRFDYDALNRQIRASDPLSNTQQLFYTARGELERSIDALGRTTGYTYDELGRLTAIDYPTGTPDVSYAYDAAGNVLTMTDGLGTTSYTYDALHRIETRARDGRTVGYTYLPTGQVGSITYWNRGSVAATYDDAGRLATLAPWGAAPTSYTWRAAGLPATITRPNGVTTTFSYDAANQLQRIQHQRGATTLDDLGYTLDQNGNRTVISEVLSGATLTTSYDYDPLQRLQEARYPAIAGGPAAQTVPYALDATGNRRNDGTITQTYDAADRIVGYQYDAVGNLRDDGTTTYAYDAANRLIQTSSAGVVTTYGYDGWGTLVRETRAGVTTDFVLDEQAGLPRVLAAIRADGMEELYAYGPDGLLAQRTTTTTSDQTSYALLDAQASLLHLTDSAGSLTLTRMYDAWGSLRFTTGTATSRLGYTGELQTGALVYLRARWYHTGLGTFTARDTFAGVPNRPTSLHRYLYTEGNPVNFSDPSGQCVPEGRFFGDTGCQWIWDVGAGVNWHDSGMWFWHVFQNLGLPGAIASDLINSLAGRSSNAAEQILQQDGRAAVLGGLFRDLATAGTGRLPQVAQLVAGWSFAKSTEQLLCTPASLSEQLGYGAQTVVLPLTLKGGTGTLSLPTGGAMRSWDGRESQTLSTPKPTGRALHGCGLWCAQGDHLRRVMCAKRQMAPGSRTGSTAVPNNTVAVARAGRTNNQHDGPAMRLSPRRAL